METCIKIVALAIARAVVGLLVAALTLSALYLLGTWAIGDAPNTADLVRPEIRIMIGFVYAWVIFTILYFGHKLGTAILRK